MPNRAFTYETEARGSISTAHATAVPVRQVLFFAPWSDEVCSLMSRVLRVPDSTQTAHLQLAHVETSAVRIID